MEKRPVDMSDTPLTSYTILILTNNLLEAADLTEEVEQRGLGNAIILRTAAEAVQYLSQRSAPPRLVIFGVDTRTDEATQALSQLEQTSSRVLFIDGHRETRSRPNSAGLLRPYTSEDVDAALRLLGDWS